jgi:membrane protease YdiL (CAAX protease family)
LRNYPKLLTPTDEFIIVVVAAFGVPLVVNFYIVLFVHYTVPVITEAGLHALLIDEPIILLGLAAFLYARDWTLETVGLLPSLKETLLGVGLAFVIAFVTMALSMLLAMAGLARPSAAHVVAGPFSPITIIAVSILNPIFEESLLSGYVVTALRRRTTWKIAVAVSVTLRALCHVYQGYAVVFIVIFGFVLAAWYARYGRLWPLIVAHVFYDFFPLMAYQNQGTPS